ncbi:single-stranded DNA-binding protein [Simian adenovirus DM-2014]|uniref:DNA-binding protein n=1 Tax=Simian adenovirus DM-2014 TaxID=1560346 RepID=A0A097IW77_9ADEN|nr:single-stranded DNA-binding protein [Simian adenovirus DM-2014]AIT70984.1 single-stranded DNA-binding protein [Simian adenovirus DM-2014]
MASSQDRREVTPEKIPAVPPKKKARKAVPLPPSPEVVPDSDEEAGEVVTVGFSYPPMKILRKADGTTAFEKFDENHPLMVQARRQKEGDSSTVVNPLAVPLVSAWEKGMEFMMVLMEKYKVDKELRSTFKFLPDQAEVYRKICQAWMNEEYKHNTLTFTSHKSFISMMGRFLMAYIQLYAGVESKLWEPTGCVAWEHQCTETEGELKCLHGLTMIVKEQLIEMDVTSENAQRALKETPAKAKVVQNRWGRSVVQVRNEDARCCMFDASCSPNTFSNKSCGLFYSEGGKAQTAFRQIEAFMQACYPHMVRGLKHLLMPIRCNCFTRPEMFRGGRQTCKITPFALNVENVHVEDMVDYGYHDRVLRANVSNPSVLVFQCGNVLHRNSKASNQVNCDFKISAPDVIGALQLVRQLWQDHLPDTVLPKLVIPEFKWHAKYQYCNLTLPVAHVDFEMSAFEI